MKELNLLERSIVAPFLNEEDKETIAIYPGAFKPPHRGHLSVVEKANAVADKTIILISSAPREDVEAEESLKIWELYTKDMPNVEIKISERFSPVAEAYSLFKHNPEKNFVMAIGKGEVSRLDNLAKYDNAKPFDAGTLEDLSATRLRQAIREGDTETIRKFIPENISVEEYLNAFDQAPVNEATFKTNPNIKDLKVKQKVRYKGKEGVIKKISNNKVFIEIYTSGGLEKIATANASSEGNMGGDFETIQSPVNEARWKKGEKITITTKRGKTYTGTVEVASPLVLRTGPKENDIIMKFGRDVKKVVKDSVNEGVDEDTEIIYVSVPPAQQELGFEEGEIYYIIHYNKNEPALDPMITLMYDEYEKMVKIYPDEAKFQKTLAKIRTKAIDKPINEVDEGTSQYYDFQIILNPGESMGAYFSHRDGRIQKSTTSVDDNPLILDYRNVPGLIKAAYKIKNDKTEITIWDETGKGKTHPFNLESIKLIGKKTVNEDEEFELDFCDKCMQMKNHKDGECQKCKKEKEEVKEDCYPEHFLQDSITSFAQYMEDSDMQVAPPPRVEFVNDDEENAEGLFGKTAYYNPEEQVVVLYTLGRHPKDILRSFAHEMIHHVQNLEGRLGNIQTTNTTEDSHLEEIEREAYEQGNITFRNWTDSILHENVNEAVVSDNEIEALIAKAIKKPSSEVDLDAIEKGEELKEGAGVATVLALPVLLELASNLSNKIYRKLGLNPEEAKLYKAKKKEIDDIKEKHNISKIIDFDPNDTPEQKAAKKEIQGIEKFIKEKFPSFVGDLLHTLGHDLHTIYTKPIKLLLQGAAWFVPSGKGFKIKDPKFREKVANVIYASIMIFVAGYGIYSALKSFSGVTEAYTAIVEATEGGASILEVVESALESIGAVGELNIK